mmetsp:Transcript_27678/g.87981  ORF Transcript_27678/g.87981 Transcript_27678/m.87981 type:complete len:266 (+) Transcript_27678:515-1312(+)
MACRDAVRKASGKKRPPIQRVNICRDGAACSARSCSRRRMKSVSHSVTVMSATTYFLHCLGMESVLRSWMSVRISLVAFTPPSQAVLSCCRSPRTLPSRDLPRPISRSKQRHRGSLSEASERSIGARPSGSFSSISLTLFPKESSGLLLMLALLFEPGALTVFGTVLTEPCSRSHLLSVWFARLMRSICSACTGSPIHVGLPLAARESIQARNCSLLRPSGERRRCSSDRAMFRQKSLLKDASQKRCLMNAFSTLWSNSLSTRPP